MNVKTITLKSLKQAGWNPPSRNKVDALVKSIERIGLLVPVLITKTNEIIDGHRRLAAAYKLGWTEIPAIIAEGDHADMFAEVNGQKKALTGTETLYVYLKEPRAVNRRVAAALDELAEIAGRPMIERMAKENFSLGTWYAAKRVARAADSDTDRTIVSILRWMMKYRCGRNATRALDSGTAPSKIMAAVKNDKPIRVSYISS
jgi:hypothetical protein